MIIRRGNQLGLRLRISWRFGIDLRFSCCSIGCGSFLDSLVRGTLVGPSLKLFEAGSVCLAELAAALFLRNKIS
ncbi:hypothetical protein Micbo1qcDRAFT_158156 [Microdochium bolleyi]|uniref:Uncharacterized protein n=1 Tax=Microdochium bolleyi TaxID=196109 RepID=A0A136JFQ1_9PEZI|nr:hypothetical protein Micbo1qcDRAFT_158156 [Microdochium bolleyi]